MIQDISFLPHISDIKFTSHPKEWVDMSSYHEVRKYMIDYFSKSQDVVSLYEFGTVNAPSISDIDLMLVLKDNPTREIHDFLARDSVSSLARYLMMDNTLMVVNENGFKNIPIWDDMNLINLFGKDIEKIYARKDELLYIEIARVMDWLPERTMRMIELVSRKEIPTRATLCLINSFIYVIERLRDSFNFEFESLDIFISNFHDLRKNWFSIENNREILYDYLKRSISLGFESIHRFNSYCIDGGFYETQSLPESAIFRLNPKITSWTTQKMYYNFSNNLNEITAKESYDRCISNDRSSIIVLPMSYYQHILCYGSNNKTISSKIFSSLNPSGNDKMISGMDKDLKRVLNRRIQIIDNMGQFLKNNSINSGLLKFGWFL